MPIIVRSGDRNGDYRRGEPTNGEDLIGEERCGEDPPFLEY